METWLRRYVPPGLATWLTVAWYVAVMTAIFLTWGGEDRIFVYLRP